MRGEKVGCIRYPSAPLVRGQDRAGVWYCEKCDQSTCQATLTCPEVAGQVNQALIKPRSSGFFVFMRLWYARGIHIWRNNENTLVRNASAADGGRRAGGPGGFLLATGRSQGRAPGGGTVLRSHGCIRRSALARAVRCRLSRTRHGTLGGPEELGLRFCPRHAGRRALRLQA